MGKKDDLFEIADRQQGYFTSQQAEKIGIPRSHFKRRIVSGEWIQEQRGVYRLAHYPVTSRPELVLWNLWSRNKAGTPQGIWSHETALDIHELSDVMPSKMHMTVPKQFRKATPIPSLIQLHFATLDEYQVEMHQGFRVTSPLQTLIDVIEEGKLAEELIVQAIRDALRKGLILVKDFMNIKEKYGDSKAWKFLNEYTF